MPSISAVRILSDFSKAGFVSWWVHIHNHYLYHWTFWDIIPSFSHIFYLIFPCSLHFLICDPVSLEGWSLWPKTVSKLPRTALWLHCTSRQLVRWWDRSRQGFWLLGLYGIGRSDKWLLTPLRESSKGCWLFLYTISAAEGLIFSQTGAGLLLSHPVGGLPHLRAENENK